MTNSRAEASVEIARPLQVVDAALFGDQARAEPRDVAGLEEISREGPGELQFVGGPGRAFRVEHDPRQHAGGVGDDPRSRYRFRLLPLSPTRTRVDLEIEHDATLLERAQDALGALERQVRDDLSRLRAYIEQTTEPPA